MLPGMLFTLPLESHRGVEAGLINHLPKPHSEGGAEPDSNPGPNDHKTSSLSVQRSHRSKKQLNLVFSPSLGKVLLIYSEIKCWKCGILSRTTATSERTASIYAGRLGAGSSSRHGAHRSPRWARSGPEQHGSRV